MGAKVTYIILLYLTGWTGRNLPASWQPQAGFGVYCVQLIQGKEIVL